MLSYCGYSIALLGIELGYAPRHVHRIHIESNLVTGFFPVAVCPALPVAGLTLLMGNYITGGKVTPALEVLDTPQCTEAADPCSFELSSCVVTLAQARKTSDINTFSLSDQGRRRRKRVAPSLVCMPLNLSVLLSMK